MLKPKNFSDALYVELLDASGAPTWMARDVQDLVNLTKAGGSKSAAAAAARGTSRHVRPAGAVAEGVEREEAAAGARKGRHLLQDEGERGGERMGRGSGLGRVKSVPEGVKRAESGSEVEEGQVVVEEEEEDVEEVEVEESLDVDELLARAAAEVRQGGHLLVISCCLSRACIPFCQGKDYYRNICKILKAT